MNMRTRALPALAICLFLVTAGCAESLRHQDAEGLARQFLRSVSAGGGDRGWSLLLPVTQQTTFGGDRDAYLAMAESTDWGTFTWSIATTERAERDTYAVELDVGTSEVPHVIALLSDFEDTDHPTITVRYGVLFEGDGIWASSGVDFRGD